MSSKTVKSVSVRHHVNKSRTIPEIFDVIKNLEDNESKAKMLRAYDTKALRFVVNGLYNIDWNGMPTPDYKPNHHPPEICDSNLNIALKRIESAYNNRFTNHENSKRNMVIVLETITEREAKLLVDMIKGKKIEGVSKSVFKKAYPEFFLDKENDSE